ncbi:hypothetical protein QJS04_geneDACA023191 [Acorus gramineus]|uniref:Uncharacterized protein n=1 Tax=Acorus gramineus TaxID=55184 RepID=A0AAV9BVP2_ACOGR|nr:hypothetical protein QJS04_geneDACA023191 [Acorus gramineus]
MPTMVAQVISWQRHLDIIISALSGPRSLGEGQFRCDKKALVELTLGMLDEKNSAHGGVEVANAVEEL